MRLGGLAVVLAVPVLAANAANVTSGQISRTGKTSISAADLRVIFPQRASSQRLLLEARQRNEALGLYLVRFDSKASGEGHCGAGSEDYVILARIRKGIAHPIDSMQIQSCLDTIGLDVTDGDSFESLVKHIEVNAPEMWVSFLPIVVGDRQATIRRRISIDSIHSKLVPGPACDLRLPNLTPCTTRDALQ